jgi:hypothetical protein
MTCSRIKSVMKPSLLILCGLVLSLAASRPTVAKSPADSVKDAATVRNSSGAIKANAAKRALPRIPRAKFKANSKLSRSLSATCTCAVSVAEVSSFGSCFKQCLVNSGVSPVSLASCGAICSSGNLVGCAICVGVQEWVALACGQYCAWRKVFYNSEASLRHSRKRGVQSIKRIPKPATVVT